MVYKFYNDQDQSYTDVVSSLQSESSQRHQHQSNQQNAAPSSQKRTIYLQTKKPKFAKLSTYSRRKMTIKMVKFLGTMFVAASSR